MSNLGETVLFLYDMSKVFYISYLKKIAGKPSRIKFSSHWIIGNISIHHWVGRYCTRIYICLPTDDSIPI